MEIKKICSTCEFNFSGICTGHGDLYRYGEKIVDENEGCNNWGACYDYYVELTKNAPWYIKRDYDDKKIDYDEFISRIDKDSNGEAIPVNFYDAIEKIYGLSLVELAEFLGVSIGVINYAKSHGTVSKRVAEFSAKLCVPNDFFNEFWTSDFIKLEKCKEDYVLLRGKLVTFGGKDNKQNIKKLLSRIQCCLECSSEVAKKYYTISRVEWEKDMDVDGFSELIKEFILYIIEHNKRKGFEVITIKYLIDGRCMPKLSIEYLKKE